LLRAGDAPLPLRLMERKAKNGLGEFGGETKTGEAPVLEERFGQNESMNQRRRCEVVQNERVLGRINVTTEVRLKDSGQKRASIRTSALTPIAKPKIIKWVAEEGKKGSARVKKVDEDMKEGKTQAPERS